MSENTTTGSTAGGRVSRRALFGSGLAAAGVAAAGVAIGRGTASEAAKPARVEDFHGVHQAGIATTPQANAMFLAADIARADRGVLRELLTVWTETAAALTTGADAPENPADAPGFSVRTDFASGLDPARLTITFGLGPAVFDERFGLAGRRPKHLRQLPEFSGDALQSAWSGGDVMVQICAEDHQVVSHAFRALRARMPGLGNIRWTQHGFLSQPVDGGTSRNMFGHKDGTANPKRGTAEFDKAVWVDAADEPDWFHQGTYLVFRKIRMKTADWDMLALAEQNNIIGRRRSDGAPLSGETETDAVDLAKRLPNGELAIPADAHVRLVNGITMLRRGYNYDYGTLLSTAPGAATGETEHTHAPGTPEHTHSGHDKLDAGLLFAAYMNNPPEQFIKAQSALAATDRLNAVIQHTGSAFFAVPPGAQSGTAVADRLFDQ
ncbi:Dyp-type peroxidase [Nocardia yamanashiensis]|uniref:Dyp-type peroxidase n=1 Tax=Nocardia yamanashiensis TaxID=209247 RepID=UPI00083776AF|nr:Dyp-type peroxidase [Nocardia yamanashiensis]